MTSPGPWPIPRPHAKASGRSSVARPHPGPRPHPIPCHLALSPPGPGPIPRSHAKASGPSPIPRPHPGTWHHPIPRHLAHPKAQNQKQRALKRKEIRTNQSPSSTNPFSAAKTAFNDSSSADVVLRLFVEPSPFESLSDPESPSTATDSELALYLHSHVLRRCKYFSALLSDRWRNDDRDAADGGGQDRDGDSADDFIRISLGVPLTIESGITVLQLLYTGDFSSTINSASVALDLLPVAFELLFEECVRSCVRFLEAVPWTEEEEVRVMTMIPLLGGEESEELLARVSPGKNDSCMEMLHGLIVSAIHSYPNMAVAKAFVAKLLRDFSSKESAKRVLERAFEASLKIVKESLEEYLRPDFRGDHNETEAIQRLNLHTAMTNGRHLLWLVERMIELKVADAAVKEWSEQASFTFDLQRAFRDDAWRNIVPGLPVVVLRCTCRLANAVAAGSIIIISICYIIINIIISSPGPWPIPRPHAKASGRSSVARPHPGPRPHPIPCHLAPSPTGPGPIPRPHYQASGPSQATSRHLAPSHPQAPGPSQGPKPKTKSFNEKRNKNESISVLYQYFLRRL